MYAEQPVSEDNENLNLAIELKAHKRMKRIMRITQEIEQEVREENEYIV